MAQTHTVPYIKNTVLRIRIRDAGWVPKKSVSGSGMKNPDHISESLETFFWVKILNSLMRIRDGKNPDPECLSRIRNTEKTFMIC